MNRRHFLKSASIATGLGAAGVLAGGENVLADCKTCSATKTPKALQFDNKKFYKADGSFNVEAAKDAVMALMKFHGYPVFPGMRDKLWVSDYNTGQFTKLGLAAYMFQNNAKGPYMLMDLFLMPGQMLPEHWHLAGEGNPAKNEGWLIRWGKSYVIGIGKDNLAKYSQIVVPKCHCNGSVTAKHVVEAGPGTFVPLSAVKSRHWQFAGPQGAIISEVANVHTDSAVRHSDKKINQFFLKG